MKFKNILIASLILAVLTIGAVSASDNMTSDDVIAQEDSSDELEINDDQSEEVIAGQDVGLEVECPPVITDLTVQSVDIYLDDGAKPNVSISVDGHKEFSGVLKYYCYFFDSLTYGNHDLNVKFLGDKNFDSSSVSTTFCYSYLSVDYVDFDEYYHQYNKHGEGLSIMSPASMDAKVYVDGKMVFDGKLKKEHVILLNNLTMGEHRYKVVTQGNGKKYVPITVEGTFVREVRPLIISPGLMTASEDKYLTVELPSDANGNLKVLLNDADMNATLINGKAYVALKGLQTGEYEWNVIYSGDGKYEDYEDSGKFVIIPDPNFNFIPATTVKEGVTTKVIVTGSAGLEGKIIIHDLNQWGYEQDYEGDFKNGKATVLIAFYKLDSKKIYYSFEYGDYDPLEGSFDVDAFLKKALLSANDFKAYYTSKAKCQARIKDLDNKYAVGKNVTFELYNYDIYNKKITKKAATKTVKSDKNGYAKVKFNVAPGEYRVKVKYNGATLTKKYIVKSILVKNTVYKKNSRKVAVTSKNIKIGATLKKVDGKYLKGKKVKFTFYIDTGKLTKLKTYTAKTNSKGVASITFKNSPIKVTANQMEWGQVFDVKISYGKEVVWGAYVLYSKSPFKYYFI